MEPETPVAEAPKDAFAPLAEANQKFMERGEPAPKPEVPPEPPKASKPGAEPPPPANEPGKGDKPSATNGDLDERTLADLRDGKLIPKHRFDEVSLRAKAYEALGTPADIQAKIDKAMKAPPEPEKPAPEMTAEDKEMKGYLERLYPELKDLPKLLKEMMDEIKIQKEETDRRVKAEQAEYGKFIASSDAKILALAREKGIDVDNEDVATDIISAVLRRLESNKEIADKFYEERNLDLLKDVFESYYKQVYTGFQVKAGQQLLKDKKREATLPRPPVSGGSPETEKPEKKPDTFEEAGKRLSARLKG